MPADTVSYFGKGEVLGHTIICGRPYIMAQCANVWLDRCHVIWHRSHMNKSSVIQITDAIGGKIPEVIDVKARSVRAARENGFFPSSWYAALDELCAEVGVDCPRSAFNFKTRADRGVS